MLINVSDKLVLIIVVLEFIWKVVDSELLIICRDVSSVYFVVVVVFRVIILIFLWLCFIFCVELLILRILVLVMFFGYGRFDLVMSVWCNGIEYMMLRILFSVYIVVVV